MKILLIDDTLDHANTTIDILKSIDREFIKNDKGDKPLGYINVPNETDAYGQRRDAALKIISEAWDEFDALIIDGFLYGSANERKETLISMAVISEIFDGKMFRGKKYKKSLSDKIIYIATGYIGNISTITGSPPFKKYHDKVRLLVRPANALGRNTEAENCPLRSFNDQEKPICKGWPTTKYADLSQDKLCSREKCLIDVFETYMEERHNASSC